MHEHHVTLYSRQGVKPVLRHISTCVLWHVLSGCLQQLGAATRSYVCQTVLSRIIRKPHIDLCLVYKNSYFHTDFTFSKCLWKCHPCTSPHRWRLSQTLSEWSEDWIAQNHRKVYSVNVKWFHSVVMISHWTLFFFFFHYQVTTSVVNWVFSIYDGFFFI